MTKENRIKKPLDIIPYYLEENEGFPNNPHFPLIIYQEVFDLQGNDPASYVENLLNENNWKNSWRNSIHDYHHFHSNSHEVLAVYRGKALVIFGGPKGKEEVLKQGDVAILPAGTAHKKMKADENFAVIGAYPGGSSYDMHTGEEKDPEKVKENIRQVEIPVYDPVFGREGLLFDYWKSRK